MDAKRLGRYRVRKSGRGYVVTLPQEWIDANPINGTFLEAFDVGDGAIVFQVKKGYAE